MLLQPFVVIILNGRENGWEQYQFSPNQVEIQYQKITSHQYIQIL